MAYTEHTTVSSCSTEKFALCFFVALPKCPNCSSVTVEIWCKDCKNNYCTKCYASIHSQPALANHKKVPIAEKPVELESCDKHSDEKFKFWCSCKTLTCRDCKDSEQHSNHTWKLIEDVGPVIAGQVWT